METVTADSCFLGHGIIKSEKLTLLGLNKLTVGYLVLVSEENPQILQEHWQFHLEYLIVSCFVANINAGEIINKPTKKNYWVCFFGNPPLLNRTVADTEPQTPRKALHGYLGVLPKR